MGMYRGAFNRDPVPGKPQVIDWISVPLGVATLKDYFGDVDDDSARFALMSWYFEEQLEAFTPTAMRARMTGSRSSERRARSRPSRLAICA
jgi:exopolyphosphatase / guanosine-5'-triphosphate,3'-diphosphate pyrophosphatase